MDTLFRQRGSLPISQLPSRGQKEQAQGLCSRPRRVSGRPGWGGAAQQAGRQGHTPLITRGQRGTWAERGGVGHGA